MDKQLSKKLAIVSVWVDEFNADKDPLAQTWGRLAKVAEESGEVISAFIGATGQNPRKGTTHTMADVDEELLDVALTALAAYEHVTGNKGQSMEAFQLHVDARMKRVGLDG